MMPTTIPDKEPKETDVDENWVNPELPEEVCEAHPTKSFLSHAFIYGLGGLIIQGASIVLLPLYTHHLEPSDFGVLEILNRVGDILNICLMAGGIRLAAMAFYNQAKNDDDRNKTVTSVTTVVLLFLLVGTFFAAAFPRYIGTLIGVGNPTLVTFGIFSMLLDITTSVPLTLMQARVESLLYICVTASMFFLRVTLVIVTVSVFHLGIWGILGSSAVTSLTFGTVLTWREFARGSIRFDFKQLLAILRFALPFIPGGLLFFALRNGDRFFLVRYSGIDALGVYALGYRIATIVGAFTVGPLYQVWSARMFQAFELSDASTYVGRVFTRILATYVFVGMAFVMFAEEAIRLLGTVKYYGAVMIVGPIVLAYFFSNAANLMDAAFYVKHKTYFKPWIIGASTVVTLGLFASFIPQYGFKGAAYATLIGFAFHAAATWVISQRVFTVKYESVRLATMTISALGFVLLSQFLPTSNLRIIFKLALLISWPVLLWTTGIITTEEKIMVVSMISGIKEYLHGRFRSLMDPKQS